MCDTIRKSGIDTHSVPHSDAGWDVGLFLVDSQATKIQTGR